MTEALRWFQCAGCGDYQQTKVFEGCANCTWSHKVSDRVESEKETLRVLVALEYGKRQASDSTWRVVALHNARMGQLWNADHLSFKIETCANDILSVAPSELKLAFQDFQNAVRLAVENQLNEVVGGLWSELTGSGDDIDTEISLAFFLAGVSNKTVKTLKKVRASNVKLIEFDEILIRNGQNLRANDVKIRLVEHDADKISMGRSVSYEVRAPQEVLIESAEIVTGHNSARTSLQHVHRVVVANQWARMPRLHPSANDFWLLSKEKAKDAVNVRVVVRGATKSFTQVLPKYDLPSHENVGELFLDLGSTTTKWVLRVKGEVKDRYVHDEETSRFAEKFGVPKYDKAALLRNSQDGAWQNWVSMFVPAARHYFLEKHGVYLKDVHFTLPKAAGVSMSLFEDARTDPLLRDVCARHLIDDGRLVLSAEHELLSQYYINALNALIKAAQTYKRRAEENHRNVKIQLRRLEEWSERKKAKDRYETSNFFVWLFTADPGDPGEEPTVERQIENPAQWMEKLVKTPERLNRVIVLDAGGLSLDIAVIDNGKLLAGYSRSENECGGEALSERIGNGQTGQEGTRYKARLAARMNASSNYRLKEYESETRNIYGKALQSLFSGVADKLWLDDPKCIIIATGGGFKNKYLQELTMELARKAGLQADLITSAFMESTLDAAKSFPEPLEELQSPAIQRFEDAQAWSRRVEPNADVRYDKFAIVGGMISKEASSS